VTARRPERDTPMEFGLNLPVATPGITPGQLRDIARQAEDLGFVEVWLGEHVVLFDKPVDRYPGSASGDAFFPATLAIPDPLVAHAFIAASTERVRLGTGVMLLPQRNPGYTAKHIATLDWLSEGRLDVGLGIGWSSEEFAACGVPFDDRGRRADECIEVMRSLWTQEISEYSGEFYDLAPCRQYPKPAQLPHPPLWIGGYSDAACRRIARYGDGWYGFDHTAEAVVEFTGRIAQEMERHQRSIDDIAIVCGAYNLMPNERSEVAAYADAGVEQFVLSLRSYRPEEMSGELDHLARTLM
jgi:probable F420-dependent oxidoreductase